MANSAIFQETLLQLRMSEELEALQRYRDLQSQLGLVRVRIASIENSIERCSRQAQIAFRNGNDTVGRGNQREVQGLTLLRARQIGELAGIKAKLGLAREEWLNAMERRKILDAELRVMRAVEETLRPQMA